MSLFIQKGQRTLEPVEVKVPFTHSCPVSITSEEPCTLGKFYQWQMVVFEFINDWIQKESEKTCSRLIIPVLNIKTPKANLIFNNVKQEMQSS